MAWTFDKLKVLLKKKYIVENNSNGTQIIKLNLSGTSNLGSNGLQVLSAFIFEQLQINDKNNDKNANKENEFQFIELNELLLSEIGIKGDDLTQLSNILISNKCGFKTLSKIDISKNGISFKAASTLLLTYSSTLKEIDLSGIYNNTKSPIFDIKWSEIFKILGSGKFSNLEALLIGSNSYSETDIRSLSNCLSNLSPTLNELWIINCSLTEIQIQILSTSISKLGKLKSLYLYQNSILKNSSISSQFAFTALSPISTSLSILWIENKKLYGESVREYIEHKISKKLNK